MDVLACFSLGTCNNTFKFEPYKIVQDLKKTIINASKDQFTDAKHNGCKFDSKQAQQKNMKKLGISQEQIDMAIENNCLDILIIIPTNEIRSKGIPGVKIAIELLSLSTDDKVKWKKFQKYFTKYWLSSDEFIKMWNHHRFQIMKMQQTMVQSGK